MSIMLALVASLAWGVADFLGGLESRRTSGPVVMMWMALFATPVALGAALWSGGTMTAADVAWVAGGALLDGVGLLVYLRVLSRGQMAVIGPIAGTVGATLPVLFGIVSGDRPRPTAELGIVGAIVAVCLVSLGAEHGSGVGRQVPHDASLVRRVFARDVRLALFSGATFGLYFITFHETRSGSGMWPLVVFFSCLAVEFLAFQLTRRQSIGLPRDAGPTMAGLGVLYVVGNAAFLGANRNGLLSIAAVISSLYPVVIVVLAWCVLHERMSRAHLMGLLLAAASIVAINAGVG